VPLLLTRKEDGKFWIARSAIRPRKTGWSRIKLFARNIWGSIDECLNGYF
jgi:hypothetical protein